EPPFPQASILPLASRQSVISDAARAMCGVNSSTAASLSCALSAKCARMRRVVSIESAATSDMPRSRDCSNIDEAPASEARARFSRVREWVVANKPMRPEAMTQALRRLHRRSLGRGVELGLAVVDDHEPAF